MGELPIIYEEPLDWDRIILYYEAALSEVKTRIDVLSREYKLNCGESPIEHVNSRIKDPASIMRKININGYAPTIESIVKHINDVAGVRIVCSFTSDIFDIAAFFMKQDDIKVLKIKDYISKPKENGYMSYHMIVSVPVHLSERTIYTKVEIQIRTIAMDFWASLEHKIYYKFDGNAPSHIRRELKECADIAAFLDRKMLSLNEEIVNYKEKNEPDDMVVDRAELVSEYIGIISEE